MSTNHSGLLGRADLLTVILAEDKESQKILADALGVAHSDFAPEAGIQKLDDLQAVVKPTISTVDEQLVVNNGLSNPSPTSLLRYHYWQLLEQKKREDKNSQNKKQTTIHSRPRWSKKPERPSFPALMSEAEIQQRLLPRLRQNKTVQRVDLDQLIERVSRVEFITTLPLEQRRRDTQALQVIDDRQVHLMPYWLDHSWLTWHLKVSMAEYRFSQAVIEQGELVPQSIVDHNLQAYQQPPEGSTVLLLSDLGVLTGSHHKYQSLLDQLFLQGYHIVVVTPCHTSDYPDDLLSRLTLVSWEANCCALPKKGAAEETPCQRELWAETLLTLCSASVRLEPELLRSIRYTLNDHLLRLGGGPLPAAAESLVWQHSAVNQKHSVAATVDLKENIQWQAVLKDKPFELRRDVFAILREWRAGLPEEIWFEEFLTADRCFSEEEQNQLGWFEQDAADAEAFFRFMQQRALVGEGIESGQYPQTKAWLERVAGRLQGEVVNEGVLSEPLQLCLLAFSDEKSKLPGGHVVDPLLVGQQRDKNLLPVKSAWLCQHGHQLVITKHDYKTVPKQSTSLIARLDYRELKLKMTHRGNSVGVDLPEFLDSSFISLGDIEVFVTSETCLFTDLTELRLKKIWRPEWVESLGCDAYGLFAKLMIPVSRDKDVAQYFRHVVPHSGSTQQFRFWLSETYKPSNASETEGLLVADSISSEIAMRKRKVFVESIGALGGCLVTVANEKQLSLADTSFSSYFTVTEESAKGLPVFLTKSDFRIALIEKDEYIAKHSFLNDCLLSKMSWVEFALAANKNTLFSDRLKILSQSAKYFRHYKSFQAMDTTVRKRIAGVPSKGDYEWGWFGHMRGAGKFHSLIVQNVKGISAALDEIPLFGDIHYFHYMNFLKHFKAAFSDAGYDSGAGIGGASRLLALKRPDYFVCISMGNRDVLAKKLELPVSYLMGERALENYWSEVVVPIIYSRWWNEPEKQLPIDDQQLWGARVAMLDAIFYVE